MDIVVIGGGAAGMSAASKAKRTDNSSTVTVIESGNFVSYAECGIPYYLSGKVENYESLIHYPVSEFVEKRGIKVITGKRVSGVDTDNKEIILENGEKMNYGKLVVASGASAIKSKFGTLDHVYSVRTLDEAINIKKNNSGKRIAIVGDGILGLELASEFALSSKDVSLISKHDFLFPKMDPKVVDEMLSDFRERVKVFLSSNVKNILNENKSLKIELENASLDVDSVFFAVGTVPNTQFLKNSKIRMNEHGLIEVNAMMETNVKDVYAAGDCATSINRITGKSESQPLAQVANKMGRVAGSNIAGKEMKFPGGLGTTLVKIFDYEIGFCGLNVEKAGKEGFSPESKIVKGKSRANYYPGGSNLSLKIVYDRESRRLLGAEVCSRDNGAWRLNTLETAIFSGMTVDDLFYNDLGYTPPFGPVWDPIIIAASLTMRD